MEGCSKSAGAGREGGENGVFSSFRRCPSFTDEQVSWQHENNAFLVGVREKSISKYGGGRKKERQKEFPRRRYLSSAEWERKEFARRRKKIGWWDCCLELSFHLVLFPWKSKKKKSPPFLLRYVSADLVAGEEDRSSKAERETGTPFGSSFLPSFF